MMLMMKRIMINLTKIMTVKNNKENDIDDGMGTWVDMSIIMSTDIVLFYMAGRGLYG